MKDWANMDEKELEGQDEKTVRRMFRKHSEAVHKKHHFVDADATDIKLGFIESLAYSVGDGDITKEVAAKITRRAGNLAAKYFADRQTN